jgi:hypothetical protein
MPGYVPDAKLVLHDVDEEGKMFQFHHHDQKLAIAFGLMIGMMTKCYRSPNP